MAKVFGFNREKGREMENITVFDVAKAFLTFESMPHKKLQKLCYYAYAWYLTLYGTQFFRGPFEAWIHGPVHPGLYQGYKGYGWQYIDQVTERPPVFDNKALEFLQMVYRAYGDLTGDELEAVTHDEEPWIEARGCLYESEPSHNPINDQTIIGFYRNVLERGQTE